MSDVLTPKFDAMLRLADILETKEGKRYHHPSWRGEDPSCGTTACSLGWATIEMGEELDLTWEIDTYPLHGDQRADKGDPEFEETDSTLTSCPFVAGAYAFNITLEESHRLFGVGPDTPKNGVQAAERIRDFVSCKRKQVEESVAKS